MSSHHFVRDGQEPALIIDSFIDGEIIGSLLEWAPLVIATDNAVGDLIDRSLKIDVLVTEDANSAISKTAHQTPVRLVESDSDMLGVALYLALSLKQTAAVILTGTPEKLLTRLKEFEGRLELTMISNKQRWSLITNGSYSRWVPAGSQLSFYSEGKVFLDDNTLNPGQNISGEDQIVHLTGTATFWIIENL